MSKAYPHLRPIADLQLDEMDPFVGPWRIKMSEIEFATHHKLLFDGKGRHFRHHDAARRS